MCFKVEKKEQKRKYASDDVNQQKQLALLNKRKCMAEDNDNLMDIDSGDESDGKSALRNVET